MARRENLNASYRKEVWDHFKPGEMQTLAAYCYAFDQHLPHLKIKTKKDEKTGEITQEKVTQVLPKYSVDNFHAARPWTIWERFRRAYMIFDRIMKENPMQKNNFAIADIQEDGSIDSGTLILEPKLREQSKEIWDALFAKDGISWGDEEKLKGYVEGHGGAVCRSYGFEKCAVPPMAIMARTMDMIDMDSQEQAGPGMDVAPEGEKKQRGRPRKEVVA